MPDINLLNSIKNTFLWALNLVLSAWVNLTPQRQTVSFWVHCCILRGQSSDRQLLDTWLLHPYTECIYKYIFKFLEFPFIVFSFWLLSSEVTCFPSVLKTRETKVMTKRSSSRKINNPQAENIIEYIKKSASKSFFCYFSHSINSWYSAGSTAFDLWRGFETI